MSSAPHQLVHPGRPVRVGFVIDTLQPGSGTENQLLLLLRHFDRKSVIPALCCLWDNPALSSLDCGCRSELLGFHRLYSPEGLRGLQRMRHWIRREMLDLVVTFFRDANFAGTLAAWSTGTPVISSRRNLGLGYWHTPWELRKLRWLNRMTRAFVANSSAVAEYTARAEKVDPSRIKVIPNAIDTDLFRPPREGEKQALRTQLGFSRNELLIGCVANLRPIKGHPGLLDAFALMTRDLPQARLVLVGGGSEHDALVAQARALEIEGQISFLGSRTDGPELLRSFDIGVLPSKAESLSNSLLEYLASGLPSIATDVGGNGELVTEGANGHLVAADDPEALAEAMRSLCASELSRTRMGRMAREQVEQRFSMAAVLETWYEYFTQQTRVGPELNWS